MPKPYKEAEIPLAFALAMARMSEQDIATAIDEHRAQVLTEGADHLDRIADQAEARVADHYGAASGIGPGSADMVREAANTLRALAAARPSESR